MRAALLALGALAALSAFADEPRSQYAPFAEITPENAARLELAWTYRTGALEPASHLNEKAAFEATPVLAGGKLLISTPFNHVIALDPVTGQEIWKYDPAVDRERGYSEVTSRGVAVWEKADAEGPCASRVLSGTIDARLIALDLATGKPCEDFGNRGVVNLEKGIEVFDRGNYQVTSAPAVIGDVVVVGSSLGDNRQAQLESGAVRAFSVRTGEQVWRWDPLPPDLATGAANAWAPLSVDAERDLVFIPTGSASPDFHGGLRPGDNRWANSVVALRGSTGDFVWGFQVVHHDLWDYDVAARPTPVVTQAGGKTVPAIAVNTKMGHYFLLDRETGKPLIEVEEKAVPESDIEGERASPTQPFPKTEPLVSTTLTEDDLWTYTPDEAEWCRKRFAEIRYEGIFTPPSEQGSLFFPGNVGGVNWGSAAYEPESGILVALVNRLPTVVTLIPRKDFDQRRAEGRDNRVTGEFSAQRGAAHAMYRETFLAPNGTPCVAPPWGLIVGVRAGDGAILWRKPLGAMPTPVAPIPGDISLGGPLVTAGGLAIASATRMDPRLHIHDLETGDEVAHFELPAAAQSTPMSYLGADGRQYIVIAAGGHGKIGSKMGDYVVAFALPKDTR